MQEKTTFIYGLECPTTKKIRYVGKADDIKRRLRQHIYQSKNTEGKKNQWIKSLLKENLKPNIKVLSEVPYDEWGHWEDFWIKKMKFEGSDLLNKMDGGHGYGKHSKETIEKISNSLKGKNNPMYGVPNPNKVKGKTLIEVYGKERAEEIGENISKSKKGKGIKHTEETKKKLSKKAKERFKNGQINGRSTITVEQVKEIKILLSEGVKQKVISEKFNVNIHVVKNISQKRSWKWVDN